MTYHTVCVLGLGYIGLPTASTLATHNLNVIGVDVNPHIVARLQNGDLHIHEPGLHDLVSTALKSGRLSIRNEPAEADAFIISVPTPFYEDKKADLHYVVSAAEGIAPCLRRGNLVILESTSPPRTTVDVVAPILEASGLKAGEDFYLAYSPERVLPGKILSELIENARVIGGVNPASAQAGKELYSAFVKGEIVLTDATTAEMVKLMENTYRDINIAIANEFARLAARLGVDVWEAVSLANKHPRVNILSPGAGVGGHCIGVDPWFLVEAAPDITPLIHTARMVNDKQPNFVLASMRRVLGDLRDRRIAILGLTYKADIDDVRESPAVELACLMADAGVVVSACEPFKPDFQLPRMTVTPELADAWKDAEALVLLVGHTAFRNLNPQEVARQTPARIVFDIVNGWQGAAWQKAGFEYYRLGDGKAIRMGV